MSDLQSKSLGIAKSQMSQGKMSWEQTWQLTLNTYMEALVKAQADASQRTYFGLTADQWVSAADKAVLEAAQKTLDGINGALEQGEEVANLGIKLIAAISGTNVTFQINVPDFSNGVFVAETPLEHQLSKMIGGVVVTSLLTAGIGELLGGAEVAAETAGEATEAAEATAAEEEAGSAAAGNLDSAGEGSDLCPTDCFVAGTEVVTGVNADGIYSQTPIQNIQVGAEVLSQNQFDPSAPPEEEIVTAVQQHTVYELQNVTVLDADGTTETISTTPDHPFYVEGSGWTNADGLLNGDELEEPDGEYGTVISSVSQIEPTGVTVYNFTVNNDHTYFVDQGGDAVWVHNVWCDAFHHIEPKYLGGDPAGAMIKLPGQIHQLVHQQIDQALIDEWGSSVEGFGRSTAKWKAFFAENAPAQSRALEIARDTLAETLKYTHPLW